MRLLDSFPVLLVDRELQDDSAAGRVTRTLVQRLRDYGTPVITARGFDDAEQIVANTASLSCVLLDWDAQHALSRPAGSGGAMASREARLVMGLHARNPDVPIFLLADRSSAEALPGELLGLVRGYIWKLEETPEFVTARVLQARREYLDPLLPPFLAGLVRFTEEARFSWHTPGHSGGAAFLKSPVGCAFHEFFGENTLRSDLSVSVVELGSLLEHTGPVGAAEAEAAQTFGAQQTFFVTNGTSTANKIVIGSCVRPGDVVLVDRNCHKSVMHAIVITGAIPVYLQPARNAHGIIGPVPPARLEPEAVRAAISACPLVPDGQTDAALAVMTNSTYDGLCYDADSVLNKLSASTRRVLFDEAWFAYAHFHPLYAGRHAMGVKRRPGQAATFATQSTHKLLTAFSQASMLHVRDPDGVVQHGALSEAFMMHTSTSPQYGVIASLDTAARMMAGPQGTVLIHDAITEAVNFRRQIAKLRKEGVPGDWAFDVWEPPEAVLVKDTVNTDAQRERAGASAQAQAFDPKAWELHEDQTWHGFSEIGHGHVMLDPIKVTILAPGVEPDGELSAHGIPAAVVSHFLDEHGIVVEKTGSYSLLVLFSLGITPGKAGTLLMALQEFKRLYDTGAPLGAVLPRLVSEHPQRYGGDLTLKQLADALHDGMRDAEMNTLLTGVYGTLPTPVVTPAVAYRKLVSGETELVPLRELAGRVSATMVVPYPPGIPMIMAGEQFDGADSPLIRYLAASELLAARFPGFETEIHGVDLAADGSYRVPCLVGS
ncbi:MAG: Orn/Lys/Arg decarboxylase N-terminal domain-containing protein [Solirubrobacteraceae bacterium]